MEFIKLNGIYVQNHCFKLFRGNLLSNFSFMVFIKLFNTFDFDNEQIIPIRTTTFYDKQPEDGCKFIS